VVFTLDLIRKFVGFKSLRSRYPDSLSSIVLSPLNGYVKMSPYESGEFSFCYTGRMFAQKFHVTVVIGGKRRPCPLDWLDSFCMRNFTNSAEFDDTLPTGEGSLEASFRVKSGRFAEALGAWLTQRGKGDGQPVVIEIEATDRNSTEEAPNTA
jgi:hypothetical protein